MFPTYPRDTQSIAPAPLRVLIHRTGEQPPVQRASPPSRPLFPWLLRRLLSVLGGRFPHRECQLTSAQCPIDKALNHPGRALFFAPNDCERGNTENLCQFPLSEP